MADHVNLGLIPSSETGWPVACAALRSDKGGWLHVHGNVTSGLTHTKRTLSTLSSPETSFLSNIAEKSNVSSSQPTMHCSESFERGDHSLFEKNEMPSCNKNVKAEWLDWGVYVAQTLLQHLKKSHDNQNWNVQVRHIQHVKSYAPHIDHVVLDVECRPVPVM